MRGRPPLPEGEARSERFTQRVTLGEKRWLEEQLKELRRLDQMAKDWKRKNP